MTTFALIWLYGWGVVMCAAMNVLADDENHQPQLFGSLFWPILVPVVFTRRLALTLMSR